MFIKDIQPDIIELQLIDYLEYNDVFVIKNWRKFKKSNNNKRANNRNFVVLNLNKFITQKQLVDSLKDYLDDVINLYKSSKIMNISLSLIQHLSSTLDNKLYLLVYYDDLLLY
jgi:hypothetical protein